MTAIAGLALGPLAGAALRFPKTAEFLGKYGKYLLGAAAAVGIYFAGAAYLHHRDDANYTRGFRVAEKQAQDLVRAANARAAKDNAQLALITQRFGFLTQQRQAEVKTIIQPQIERITREVQSNPVYRQCLVTDGVFNDLQAATAAVNARLGTKKP